MKNDRNPPAAQGETILSFATVQLHNFILLHSIIQVRRQSNATQQILFIFKRRLPSRQTNLSKLGALSVVKLIIAGIEQEELSKDSGSSIEKTLFYQII